MINQKFLKHVKEVLGESNLIDAAWVLPDGTLVGHDGAYDGHGYDAELVFEGTVCSPEDDTDDADDANMKCLDHQDDLVERMQENGLIRVNTLGQGEYLQLEG